MMKTMIRTYSELIKYPSFETRYTYLKLDNDVGVKTFGFDRYINQNFYNSREWKQIRNQVILRDDACDLAMKDRQLLANIRIHHMNPISIQDFEEATSNLLDPEFLICVSHDTHNAIHFGTEESLIKLPKERRKGDTTPWKVY